MIPITPRCLGYQGKQNPSLVLILKDIFVLQHKNATLNKSGIAKNL